tara:strand:+ start:3329 stop:3535 length:207 start_codon:yes stop_codon:yes gene_type:complete
MIPREDGKPAVSAEVSRHLSAAHQYLYLALLHLAAIEGDLKGDNLVSSRLSIATSLEKIKNAHEGTSH